MKRPFKEEDRVLLSSYSLDTLVEWLKINVKGDLRLTEDYKVSDLIDNIEDIQGGMWSDSIDAMGEDA